MPSQPAPLTIRLFRPQLNPHNPTYPYRYRNRFANLQRLQQGGTQLDCVYNDCNDGWGCFGPGGVARVDQFSILKGNY